MYRKLAKYTGNSFSSGKDHLWHTNSFTYRSATRRSIKPKSAILLGGATVLLYYHHQVYIGRCGSDSHSFIRSEWESTWNWASLYSNHKYKYLEYYPLAKVVPLPQNHHFFFPIHHINVLQHLIIRRIRTKLERPHPLLIHNLNNEIRLINQKPHLQLLHTLFYQCHGRIFRQILIPISIHNR